MRCNLLVLLFLAFSFTLKANVEKKPRPAWVQPIRFEQKDVLETAGGFQYLLIDLQENVPYQTVYKHFAIKILNAEGVQSMSTIDPVYDPTYQTMNYHEIKIYRAGEILERLDESEILELQREQSMERSLYDGSVSAVINLSDVRAGDILEYAFSIEGFNPVNAGQYTASFYHQYNIPVNRIYNRVISSQELQVKMFNGASEPQTLRRGDHIEYIWDEKALDKLIYDNNVPSWSDAQKHVMLTTFSSWSKVVEWALPLYDVSGPAINMDLSKYGSEKIPAIIRAVQDEIRYLGFQSGIGAYKPNPPEKVYQQRYGDCKDKSLLLVTLLRQEGLEAYPMLVNTTYKDKTDDFLPSNAAFNHCVVTFRYNDEDYFVDPTISHQGGDLSTIHFPDYGKGLVLRQGEDHLISLPQPYQSTIRINELIDVESIGGGASYTVRTEYTGSKADYIRSYFNSTAHDAIQKENLNYYSKMYPDLKVSKEMKYFDYDRETSNKVIIEEYYEINNFWKDLDTEEIYAEIFPLVLHSYIDYPKSAGREMPYHLGDLYHLEQVTQVTLPEAWQVENSTKEISGDGFTYEYQTWRTRDRIINVKHAYSLLKTYIPAGSFQEFQAKHDEIIQNLSFILTYNPSLSGFQLSWVSIMLALISLIAGVFYSVKIYRNYNPAPWIYAEDKPLGSWLILPAIGLTLTPFILILDILGQDFFNANTWKAFFSGGVENGYYIAFLVAGELIANVLFIVYSLLLIVLFYSRRTSVPRLMTIFYCAAFGLPLVDLIALEYIMPNSLSAENYDATYRQIARGFFGALIWIPYFNVAERVKSTFCRRFKMTE